MKSIVIVISGRGSNMRAIVKACEDQCWKARVVAVIADRPDAGGLAWANEHGIPTLVVDHRRMPERAVFDAALQQAIDRFEPDAVALAGFMRILGAGFTLAFSGRMLNIHPSLLPAFPGLKTHRRALDAGCKIAGATVHFVTPQLDHGPIVIQAAVPVLADDDAQTLAARVLQREHAIYPRALRWFVEGRLRVQDGVVKQLDGEPQYLL